MVRRDPLQKAGKRAVQSRIAIAAVLVFIALLSGGSCSYRKNHSDDKISQSYDDEKLVNGDTSALGNACEIATSGTKKVNEATPAKMYLHPLLPVKADGMPDPVYELGVEQMNGR